jgi:transcriptional regulator with XRE-family HTH domain
MKGVRPRLQQRIGQVVRRHREAKKWSQEAFADHIKMHRAQYGFLEQGKRDLRLSSLERVAQGLEEPMWMILREAEGS